MAFIENVSTLRRRRYKIRWREGTVCRSRTVDTKGEALEMKREVEEHVKAGARFGVLRRHRVSVTLGQLLQRYLRIGCLHVNEKTLRQRQATLIRFDDFLRGRASSCHPTAMNRDNLSEFYHHELARGLSQNSAAKYLSIIHTAWQWLAADVADSSIVLPFMVIKVPRTPPPRRISATWEDMDRCIRLLSGVDRRVAIVARFTGLRNSQLARLIWGDLLLERGELLIRPELGKSSQERRGRIVPLSPHLLKILEGWAPRLRVTVPAYGFEQWEATQPLIERNVHGETFAIRCRTRKIGNAWKNVGCHQSVYSGRPLHAFRAGFITELQRTGANHLAICHLIGHSGGLAEHYVDPYSLPLQEVVNQIPDIGCCEARLNAHIA